MAPPSLPEPMRPPLLLAAFLCFAALLVLAACTDDPAVTPATPADEAVQSALPATGGGDAACLVGTWEADVESVYGPEFWARLLPAESGMSMAFTGSDGRALMTFGPDGSATQRFEAFTVTIDGTTPAGPMRTTMAMDGTAEGRYTVEGGALRMTPVSADVAATSTVTMNGQSMGAADVEFNDLFTSGEGSAVAFTCTPGEIQFDIDIPDSDVDFENIRYTRVE